MFNVQCSMFKVELAKTNWSVRKKYSEFLFRNSLENFLLSNVQTVAIIRGSNKIL